MAVTRGAGILKLSAEDDAVAGGVVIKKIRWVNPTTAGHLLNITDTGGTTIFASSCAVAHEVDDVDFEPPLIVQGIDVDDLDSGAVYIYA